MHPWDSAATTHSGYVGNGRIFTVCNVDGPPTYPALTHMNYPKPVVESVVASLNWATIEEDYVPGKQYFPSHASYAHLDQAAASDPVPEQARSDKQKSRLNKRKAATNTLQTLREELFTGEFDG